MIDLGDGEITLHRYFLWANRLRGHFKSCGEPPSERLARKLWFNQAFAYVGLWLGLLFVLVEGWRDLELEDPEVSRLLDSPNVELLRRFRNGAFHFQRSYFDARFTELLFSESSALSWAEELHEAIGTWFLKKAELSGVKIEVIRDLPEESSS